MPNPITSRYRRQSSYLSNKTVTLKQSGYIQRAVSKELTANKSRKRFASFYKCFIAKKSKLCTFITTGEKFMVIYFQEMTCGKYINLINNGWSLRNNSHISEIILWMSSIVSKKCHNSKILSEKLLISRSSSTLRNFRTLSSRIIR